jgi:hypothetical protein
VGNSAPLVILGEDAPTLVCCFLANLNSLTLDYATRQKIAGAHMNFFFVNQLPVLTPGGYSPVDIGRIAPRLLELVYTAWDIKPFADDLWREADVAAGLSSHNSNGRIEPPLLELIRQQWQENKAATGGHEWNPPECAETAEDGIPLPPFKWDEDRRAQIRAELDAYYALLYGLTRDELRYILDPKEVYGPDFPGETFRVLKEKEEKPYGDYRTRRLVFAAYDELAKSERFAGEKRESAIERPSVPR